MRVPVDQEYRAGKLWPVLTETAARNETITYGAAGRLIGVYHRAMRFVLGPIQSYCLDNGLPPLTALVVNKTTRQQGNGYIAGRPGDSRDLSRVVDFDWSTIANPFPGIPEDELERLSEELITDPAAASQDVYALVKVRDRQRIFRAALLKAYDGACAMCGLSFDEALEAAHILPWAGGKARLDPRNGILLCATHHRLFDAGWLQVDEELLIRFYDPDEEEGDYSRSDRQTSLALHGKKISVPTSRKLWPKKAYLRQRLADDEED